MTCNTLRVNASFSTFKKAILISSAVLISHPVLGMETDKYSPEASMTMTTASNLEAVASDEIAVKSAAAQRLFSTDPAPDASSTFAGSIDFVAPEPIDELIAITEGRLAFIELQLQKVNAEMQQRRIKPRHRSIRVKSTNDINSIALDLQEILQDDVSHFSFIIRKLNEIKRKDDFSADKIEINALYVLVQCELKKELMGSEMPCRPEIRAASDASRLFNIDVYKEMAALLEKFDILRAYKNFHHNFSFAHKARNVSFQPAILLNLALNYNNINKKLNIIRELVEKQKSVRKQKAEESSKLDSGSDLISAVLHNCVSTIESFNANVGSYTLDLQNYEVGFDFIRNVPPIAYDYMTQSLHLAIDLAETDKHLTEALAHLQDIIQGERNLRKEKKQEKERAFEEEQARFRLAYEERLEARRVETERLRAEADAREGEKVPAPNPAATIAAVAVGASSGAPKVKIKTRNTSASAAIDEVSVAAPAAIPEITSHIQELVEQTREADFDAVQALLTTKIDAGGLGAQCTPTGEGYKFAFNSPVTDQHTIFYVHKPHGAQLEKGVAVGWRKNMRAAFIRAGMILR